MIKWPRNPNLGDIYSSPNGLKWRWNGKAWSSLRESDIVYLTGPTGPAGAPGESAVTSVTYKFSHSVIDPVDNMSYYIGDIPDSPPQSNNSIASKRIKSLIGGKIKQVSLMTQILGNLGSSENQKFIINNFTKQKSVTIISNYKHLSNNQLDNYILSEHLDVSVNDELEIIWQVTTFLDSPTLVRHSFNVFIEG